MVGKVAIAIGVDSPFNRTINNFAASRTAKDLQCIKAGGWRYPRWHFEIRGLNRRWIRSRVGAAIQLDAIASGNARDMGAVAITIHRVGVGCWDRLKIRIVWIGIVGVAGKIIAAHHLGTREAGHIADHG